MHIVIHNNTDLHDRLEIIVHQDGEYVCFSPKDDDHADLIVDSIQRGIYEQLIIDDRR